MPARIHALLVVRADAEPSARHLARTLEALAAQARPADALTLVVCGTARGELDELIRASGAEGVITAPRSTGYAGALALATHRLGEADAVWLLAQDVAPQPDALQRLVGALEVQPTAWLFAPKLVDALDRGRIVSLGETMTTLGRSVGLVDGQLDQGQYDATEDALGADVRGLLVRRAAWEALGGLDAALRGGDEGLDLGVRARLAGGRVVLVPGARVAVHGDGVAGLPAPVDAVRRRRRTFQSRVAQLHRRLAYAPALALVLHWLSIPVLAVLRTILHLVRKQPGDVLPEWGASALAWIGLPAIARARGRIRQASRRTGIRVPWAQLSPLRVTRGQLARRLDGPDGEVDAPAVRSDLRFFTGGGAWAVLAALVTGVGAFFALLAWSTIGGGGLLPLPTSLGALWSDAAYGHRALGLDETGAADPFAALIAAIGSLTPWNPGQAIVLLWILALPLAMLGGWFAATRVTERSGLRIAGGILWTLAPTFLVALIEGRPAGVLVHLLLPWLFYAGAVARRSWAAAALASLVLAAVIACAPSLAPALLVLWLLVLVTSGRGVLRAVWLPLPTLALFAPLIWERGVIAGEWSTLLADPGRVFTAAQNGGDTVGRLLLALGLPTPDLGTAVSFTTGWGPVSGLGAWAWALVLPLVLIALLSLLTVRAPAGAVFLFIALVGVAGAVLASVTAVQNVEGVSIALWPGSALSLAWLGLVGAALAACDAPAARPVRILQSWGAALAVLAVIVLAVPAITAHARDASALTNGPRSTLPSYVWAAASGDDAVGTLVLAPLSDGSVAARLVWGSSETLSGQSTARTTRTSPTGADQELAELSARLMAPGAEATAAELGERGIGFVFLLPPAAPATPAATSLEAQATAALDARSGWESVDTGRGTLWRVATDVSPRAEVSADVTATARMIALVQLAVLVIILLLAFPTAASRRAARAYPRVVGARTASRPPRRREKTQRPLIEAEEDDA